MESIFLLGNPFSYLLGMHNSDVGLLALRLAVGAIFLIHGAAKLKSGTLVNFRLLGISETIAAIVVILGLGIFTEIFALWLVIVMMGAIYFKIVKWHIPFTVMDKMGWEFDLILLAANITILFAGGGSIAVL